MTIALRKVVIDTNVYVDWLNRGRHLDVMLGAGLVRHLSAVVQMELRVGARTLPAQRAIDKLSRAYRSAGRLIAPDAETFDAAGRVLRRLRDEGREARKASLVNDVLIALTARKLGAEIVTRDGDFDVIGPVTGVEIRRIAR